MVDEYDLHGDNMVHLPTKIIFKDMKDVLKLVNGQARQIYKLKLDNNALKKEIKMLRDKNAYKK